MNIAARLEGANKRIGTNICVSGDTARRAIKHIFRPIGHVYVEGKSNSVEVWEPITNENVGLANLKEYQLAYEKLDKKTKGAMNSFQNLDERYPSDYLVQFHLNRLKDGQTGTIIEIKK